MKKFFFFFLLVLFSVMAKSQVIDSTVEPNKIPSKKWSQLDLSTRANDHFLIQYGLDAWPNIPDSINTSGFSRHFNVYIMLDKPFQGSPHFSLGIGIGLGTSNIFFSNSYVNLKSRTAMLPFSNVSGAEHFNKFKLSTSFAEVPLELRFSGNPAQPDKGVKIAVGLKGGLILNAHTKGKNLLDATGATVYDIKYINKESDKKFINNTRFAATGRIGYGHISIDGSYQISNFLKTGVGPAIHPYSIGLTLSGL